MALELDDDPREGSRSQSRELEAGFEAPQGLTIIERLGEGGFGSVYAVREEATGRMLALKRLERVDAESVQRFKQEFRILKERSHPQLVKLHELYCQNGRWSFSMDLVRGTNFRAWIVPSEVESSASENTETTGDCDDEDAEAPPFRATGLVAGSGAFSEERLRDALRQLVAGIVELHSQGILHRDLKPSNVIVREDGRLFILDFGIALFSQPDTAFLLESLAQEGRALGTPAYMSPEQARGAPVSMASDWYAVGVMLFEVLTGQLPFIGTRADMLRARVNRDVRDPRCLREGLPEDLCQLCMDLLKRDPFARPSGFNIGVRVGLRPSVAISPRTLEGGELVGRELELAQLNRAFEESRAGRTVVAHVHGDSGFGKTATVERFVAQLGMKGEAIVFRGRCFENESTPFKALDDLLEGIGRHLGQLPELEAAGLMPRDMPALTQVFPALGRIPIAHELSGRAPSADVHELRRRAFQALRELLARLSDVRPVVVFLDDVHWADGDSAELIRELLGSTDSPRLLLVAAYWARPEPQSELLKVLQEGVGEESRWYSVDVPVGPLSGQAALRLAQELLASAEVPSDVAKMVARESEGSPLFVAELVRAARTMRQVSTRLTLNEVFQARILALPLHARRVLGALTASERGISEREVSQVCSLSESEALRLLELLRDERLVAVVSGGRRQLYTVHHEKVRRAVYAAVSDQEMREHHKCLAHFCESAGMDPEMIAHHYLSAGDRRSGFFFTEKAGDSALRRSAIASALAKYEQALALAPNDARLRILEKLAPTLGRCGHGPASAQTHLRIAGQLGGSQEHVRQAGEQYLLCGMTSHAMDALRPMLEVFDLRAPRGKLLAAMTLYYQRKRLLSRLKRARAQVTSASGGHRSAEVIAGVDLSWTLANGFAGIDVFLSVHYTGISLWRALGAGDPERIARALSLYAILRALEGKAGQQEAEVLLEYADHFAELSLSNHARGWVMGARAILSLSCGELTSCEEQGRGALGLLRDSESLSFREIGTLSVWFWLFPTFLLGKLEQFVKESEAIARESQARGDLYTLSTTKTYVLPLQFLIRDRPVLARNVADEGLQSWADDRWQNQHWAHLHSLCLADLYEGGGQDILKRINLAEPQMKAAFQLMIQAIRIDCLYLEGRALLLCADQDGGEQRLLTRVQRIVRLLREERSGFSGLYASTLEAGLLAVQERPAARSAFSKLSDEYSARSMTLHAAGASLRAAQLSEESSRELAVERALAALGRLGVAAPSRFADLLMPKVN